MLTITFMIVHVVEFESIKDKFIIWHQQAHTSTRSMSRLSSYERQLVRHNVVVVVVDEDDDANLTASVSLIVVVSGVPVSRKQR